MYSGYSAQKTYNKGYCNSTLSNKGMSNIYAIRYSLLLPSSHRSLRRGLRIPSPNFLQNCNQGIVVKCHFRLFSNS